MVRRAPSRSRGGAVVGYLVGAPRGASWGPNIWVEGAGHAVTEPEIVRDLYGAAAAGWVDEAPTSHYAVVPATDPALVDAWFRVGFGQQHVHAIRDVAGGRTRRSRSRPALTIRRRGAPRHPDARAGSSSRCRSTRPTRRSSRAGRSPTPRGGRRGVRGRFDDPRSRPSWPSTMGASSARPSAARSRCRRSTTASSGPTDAGFLGFAAVLPEARGLGAGRALGEASWSGRATRVTRRSSPTGARRTCCRAGPGRDSASGRPSDGCFRAIV